MLPTSTLLDKLGGENVHFYRIGCVQKNKSALVSLVIGAIAHPAGIAEVIAPIHKSFFILLLDIVQR